MRWKLFLSYFILVLFNISLLGFLFYLFTMGHFMSTRESYLETASDYFVKFVTANMENDGQLIGTSKFFLRQNWEKMDYELIVYDRSNLIIADSRSLDEQMGIFSMNSKGDEKILSVLMLVCAIFTNAKAEETNMTNDKILADCTFYLSQVSNDDIASFFLLNGFCNRLN